MPEQNASATPQHTVPGQEGTEFRAGFVALVGRPNAGKSTLTNALVGQKIAITSSKPQTTRHVIRGIVHSETGQVILVDTPGLHRPRTLLGERLGDLVRETFTEVDAITFCIPANEKIGPGDRFIAAELVELQQKRRAPKILAAVTKTDLVSRKDLADQLLAVSGLLEFDEIIPVSALTDSQVDVVHRVLLSHLPVSPPLYPQGTLTEESDTKLISEFVREAALEGVRDELPHSVAAVVEEIVEESLDGDPFADVEPGTGRLVVRVNIFVERDSQKAIVIGRGGSRLKQVGSTSRRAIQGLLGRKIYLDLRVKVAKDWQRDPKQLRRLGF